ncbi:MAG: hypothetical protein JW984_15440 [Deltaproteobacteria bacterium]|uniref:Uncharacterized protein n=1 Tax=Candidatus Zymogenus saltonus TaxID=2844893 RepID=A0A9D8KJ04_9DELT|nr:hypothetical protein [Candidatus Zymogenus saltonus]
MKSADKNELLIRCWTTPRGTWLYYCHLIGIGGIGELRATSVGPMGMRRINRMDDLECVLKEILTSFKTASLELSKSPSIRNHIEDSRPRRAAHSKTRHHTVPLPLQKGEIPAAKPDLSFCTYISILERFFKTLPFGYSTTRSCADCAIKKNEDCLKEYRFGSADDSNVDCRLSDLYKIDLKWICLET